MCASDDQNLQNHSQTLWTKLHSASNSLCQSQLPQHIRTSKIAFLTWSKRFNTSIKTICLENRKCNQTTASITKRPAHASSPKARCLAAQRCLRRKKHPNNNCWPPPWARSSGVRPFEAWRMQVLAVPVSSKAASRGHWVKWGCTCKN
jgi:hypothetical protein